MVCLDTTFLIDLIDRSPVAEKKLEELRDRKERLTTTPINAAELFKGAYLSKDRDKELQRVNTILKIAQLLPVNIEACEKYGQIISELQKKGETIGDMDTLIASIALSHNQQVVTNDVDDFRRVPGLTIQLY